MKLHICKVINLSNLLIFVTHILHKSYLWQTFDLNVKRIGNAKMWLMKKLKK